jgi:hypothetical protein
MFSALAPTTDITEARQGAADCSVAGIMAILLAVVTLTNAAYQIIHKPTKLCFVGNRLDKEPAAPWWQLVGRVSAG